VADYLLDLLAHDLTTIDQTVRPENLSFTLNDEAPHTMTCELSLSAKNTAGADAVSHDFIGPKRTGFKLRYGTDVIMGGYFESVRGSAGAGFMQIAGTSWLGYLDGRFFPFRGWDPTHVNDYVIGSPPQGLAYEISGAGVHTVWQNLWDSFFGMANSMPLTYLNEDISLTIPYFRVDLADTTTLLGHLQALSVIDPGFTYFFNENTRELRFKKYARYGNPTTLVSAGSGGANIAYVFDAASKMELLEFENVGPKETHIMGSGAGLAWQWVVSLGAPANQAAYWRWDGTANFENSYTESHLEAQVRRQFAQDLNPQHQIPLKVNPANISGFWSTFKPGVAIWIDYDLGFHAIDSPQHVVQMTCNVDRNGNAIVDFGLDQIYDTSGMPGIPEG
jgi:hypothetical protein